MDELVETLLRRGALHSKRLADAFRTVDRMDFVGEWNAVDAYEDTPLPIGAAQTISQPSTVAFMLELLDVRPGHKVLDVGSGSCWSTALLSRLVGSHGRVIGVERVQEVLEFGRRNLAHYDTKNVTLRIAARRYGCPDEAPFDRILVSASSRSLPEELVRQLTPQGVMVVPVRESIWKVQKRGRGDVSVETYNGFVFVPLIRD